MIMKKNKSISASRLPKRAPGKCCNARTKQRVGYCRKPSGWGTGHAGQGRCRVHGGFTPTKHGVYSSILPTKFHELLEEIKPEEITNLVHEQIRLKTLLIELTDVWDTETEIDIDENGDPIKNKLSNLTIQEKIDYTIKIIGVIGKNASIVEANRDRVDRRGDKQAEFLKFIAPLVDKFFIAIERSVKDGRVKRGDIPREVSKILYETETWGEMVN